MLKRHLNNETCACLCTARDMIYVNTADLCKTCLQNSPIENYIIEKLCPEIKQKQLKIRKIVNTNFPSVSCVPWDVLCSFGCLLRSQRWWRHSKSTSFQQKLHLELDSSASTCEINLRRSPLYVATFTKRFHSMNIYTDFLKINRTRLDITVPATNSPSHVPRWQRLRMIYFG